VRRAAVGAAAVGAATAAARSPQGRSVISRVVEQVRDKASGIGSSVSNLMPGHREEEMGGMGGGETDSDMNDEF